MKLKNLIFASNYYNDIVRVKDKKIDINLILEHIEKYKKDKLNFISICFECGNTLEVPIDLMQTFCSMYQVTMKKESKIEGITNNN